LSNLAVKGEGVWCEPLVQVQRLSRWQEVIHGRENAFRVLIVNGLLRKGDELGAERYALCGRGDRVKLNEETGEYRVSPRGCGKRVCPRCSRKRGIRFMRRVSEILEKGEHDRIGHVVLTQRVHLREGLRKCSERFNAKFNIWRGNATRRGMVGGLGTVHIVLSRKGGWHFHMHVLMEVREGFDFDDSLDRWIDLVAQEEKVDREFINQQFVRIVCEAGPAVEIGGEEIDLFGDEQLSPVGKALGYVTRDILQGVGSLSRSGEELNDAQIDEFIKESVCLKSHRLFGRWRESKIDRKEKEKERKEASKSEVWKEIGIADEVYRMGMDGVRLSVNFFEYAREHWSSRNGVGARLSQLCDSVLVAVG